jgi:hypothetical protein
MRGTFDKRSLSGACGVLTCLLLSACEQALPTGAFIDGVEPPLVVESPPLAQHPDAVQPPGGQVPDAQAPAPETPDSHSPTPQTPVPRPTPPAATGQTWYVSTKGSHSGRGTIDSPLRTIGAAAALAKAGDTIKVLSGVYSEQLFLESRTPSLAPITLRGEGSPLPTIIPAPEKSRSAVILVRGHWNLENLRIDVGGARMSAIVFERGGSKSRVSGSELKGGASGAGILVAGATNITIEDNEIHHFIKPGDDSHGVLVVGPSRSVTVRNNDIHHNSGDSVQCQAYNGVAAEDLIIEGNSMHDEGENAVDIKLCNRVTIRNNEMRGFPNTAIRRRGSSAGEAVIIHDSARNVTIRGNLMSRAGRGISVVAGHGLPPENVRIEDNTIQEIRNFPEGNGQGIRVESGRNVQVLDNTVESTASYGMMLAADQRVVFGLVVKKNTLRPGPNQLLMRLGHELSRPGLVLRQNHYGKNGILKGDGLRELLGGRHAPYRGKFTGEHLLLTAPDKLDAWRQVLNVDHESGLVD